MIGFLPGFGGVVLIFVFCKTVWDARSADYGYGTLFGVGTVLVIGTLLLVLGIPLMFVCARKYPTFFSYRHRPARSRQGPEQRRHAGCPVGHLPRREHERWPAISSSASVETAAASRPRGAAARGRPA